MRPTIAIHSVFIAKENILFLKEWIVYHQLLGVSKFFLYDNSGVQVKCPYAVKTGNPHLVPGKVNKRGIDYDQIVGMTDDEVQDKQEQLVCEIGSDLVHIVKWQPRDQNGLIVYGQQMAHRDAIRRYGDTCDWMVNIDIDEFLVCPLPLSDIVVELENQNCSCGIIGQIKFRNRFDQIGTRVTDIDDASHEGFTMSGHKNIFKVSATRDINVHSWQGEGRSRDMFEGELSFNHYNFRR